MGYLRRPRRLGARHVAMTDTRSPLRRVLESRQPDGMVVAHYDQQWRVVWRSQRLGLTDKDQMITQAGLDWLANERNR